MVRATYQLHNGSNSTLYIHFRVAKNGNEAGGASKGRKLDECGIVTHD